LYLRKLIHILYSLDRSQIDTIRQRKSDIHLAGLDIAATASIKRIGVRIDTGRSTFGLAFITMQCACSVATHFSWAAMIATTAAVKRISIHIYAS
jgi:hypothetical protein